MYSWQREIKAGNNKILITNFCHISLRAGNSTSELFVYHFCHVGITHNAMLQLPAAFLYHIVNLTVQLMYSCCDANFNVT